MFSANQKQGELVIRDPIQILRILLCPSWNCSPESYFNFEKGKAKMHALLLEPLCSLLLI